MKKDTAILISLIILSLFFYLTDVLGKGGIILFGVLLGIGIIAILGSSKPLTELNNQETEILAFEKKYAKIILPIILINIFLFYPTIPEGSPLSKIILSITTICGLFALIGYFIGLIIGIFPFKKMVFPNRLKRGLLIGLLSIQILAMIIHLIAFLKRS